MQAASRPHLFAVQRSPAQSQRQTKLRAAVRAGQALCLGVIFWLFWAATQISPVAAQCSLPTTAANAAELEAAITCYNSQTAPGVYTITLVDDIALSSPLSSINNSNPNVQLVLNGAGHTVDGQGAPELRIFEILDATIVSMQQITVTGGNYISIPPEVDPIYFGGGIRNLGVLTIAGSVIASNNAENGGGIFNSGVVTMTDSIVRDNTTEAGFSGEGAGGDSGYGGGIYNEGKFSILASTVDSNRTGNGGDGVDGDLYGGWAGDGGGVYNEGELTIHLSTVISNSTGSGGDGGDGIEDEGGEGGPAGWGGGIYSSGPLTVTDTMLHANRTGDGGDGGNGATSSDGGFGGFGGNGGGIYSEGSTTVLRSRFIANSTGAGGQGGSPGDGGEFPGFDGEQGLGGGLAYSEGSRPDSTPFLVVTNSLFSRNYPAEGEGMAINTFDGTPQIVHNTFANATRSPGSAILVFCGDISFTNNIFANFTTGIENCDLGQVTSDHDLYFGNITDTIEVDVTAQLMGDPAFLDPASDDYHLTATSAAIDIATDASVSDDFEGDVRPQGHGFDVGFDEFAVSTITFSKQVVGGEAAPADWVFDIASGAQDITHTGQVLLPPGVYTVTEDGGPTNNANYALTGAGGACSLAAGAIQLTVDDVDATCFITNTRQTATLTLVKEVVNDNGGTAGPDDFGLTVGSTPVTSGVPLTVLANVPITISEADLPGYTFVGVTGAGCPSALGPTVTLAPDAAIVCTLVNDDIAPTVTLHKVVTNDATADLNAFGLQVNGTAVDSGRTLTVTANAPIVVDELGLPGYAFVAITGAGCPAALGGSVTLSVGEALVCTVTNQRTGVQIHRSGNDPLVEGASDMVSYTVNLIGVPIAPVTIALQPDSQVTVDPATLVFTADNASTPQVVQVVAVDDTIIEGAHTGVIGHTAASLDPHYDGPAASFYNDGATANNDPGTVLVDIIDNDTASILFRKTVSIDGYPPACASESEIKVPVNTSIVYCYTLRNTGNTTFTMHTLVDDHLGTLLENAEILLPPNNSVSRAFTATIAVTTTNIATWTASSVQPADISAAGQIPAAPLVDAVTQATVFISGPTDDQDRDGVPDNEEGAGDRDGDGIPNFLDPDGATNLGEEKEPAGGADKRIFLPFVAQ